MNLVNVRRTPWKIINPQKESYAKELDFYILQSTLATTERVIRISMGSHLQRRQGFCFFGGPSHARNLQTFLMESEF